jgi:hypothetical protein
MILKQLAALALGIAALSAATPADAQSRSRMGWSGYSGAYDSPFAGAYDSAYGGAYDSAHGGAYGYGGPSGFSRPTAPGSYYSYGADRANPSTDPSGWDQTNARDRQLNGHN